MCLFFCWLLYNTKIFVLLFYLIDRISWERSSLAISGLPGESTRPAFDDIHKVDGNTQAVSKTHMRIVGRLLESQMRGNELNAGRVGICKNNSNLNTDVLPDMVREELLGCPIINIAFRHFC